MFDFFSPVDSVVMIKRFRVEGIPIESEKH